MKLTRLFFRLAWVFMLPAFIACDDDDDKVISFSYLVDMATVVNDDEQWLLDSDNAGLLILDNTILLTAANSKKDGQRVIATFNYKESPNSRTSTAFPIELYTLYRVLTKPVYLMPNEENSVYTKEEIEFKQDSIGQDPISLSGAFVSDKHINLQFCIYRSNPNIAHFINLVAEEDAEPDAEGILTVELRHNREEDQEKYKQFGWVAFPLSSIPGYTEGNTLKLKIITNEGNGTVVSQEVDLNVNNNKEHQISETASFSDTKIS